MTCALGIAQGGSQIISRPFSSCIFIKCCAGWGLRCKSIPAWRIVVRTQISVFVRLTGRNSIWKRFWRMHRRAGQKLRQDEKPKFTTASTRWTRPTSFSECTCVAPQPRRPKPHAFAGMLNGGWRHLILIA
jgi:hypothetical protein